MSKAQVISEAAKADWLQALNLPSCLQSSKSRQARGKVKSLRPKAKQQKRTSESKRKKQRQHIRSKAARAKVEAADKQEQTV